jgi:hypothetical protein
MSRKPFHAHFNSRAYVRFKITWKEGTAAKTVAQKENIKPATFLLNVALG